MYIRCLHNFVHLPIFYKSSTLPLLNLYKEILYKVNNYSHVGNKVFPAWEWNVPTLGINAECSSLKWSLLRNKALLQNKVPLLGDKERLLLVES